jgi:hypothetical protein
MILDLWIEWRWEEGNGLRKGENFKIPVGP